MWKDLLTGPLSRKRQEAMLSVTCLMSLFNAQGDVVAIVNSSNQLVAKYAYDAWGKLLNTDSDSPAPAVVNSIRYGILIHQRNTTALLNVAGHHPLQLE